MPSAIAGVAITVSPISFSAELVKPEQPHKPLAASATDASVARLDRMRNAKGRLKTSEIRLAMQRAMQDHCAVFRTADTLQAGVRKLDDIAGSMREIGIADRSMIWNTELAEALELENLFEQAMVSLHGAVNRTESRGAHAREDFSARDDKNWLKHTVAWLDDQRKLRLGYRPVHLNTLSNEVQSFPPKARVY